MSISSQPRAGDVRALFGAIALGSGMGLAIGAAYLVGGLDRMSGVRTAPAATPAMEASAFPNSKPTAPRIVPARANVAIAAGGLRDRFRASVSASAPIIARPFHLAVGSADSSDLSCLTQVVYYEARGESEAGQEAVAQVVLNRVRHPAFPKTICGVVHQRSSAGCQFTFACKGLTSNPVDDEAWRRSRKVAASALHGSVMAGVGEATHFQTARSGAFAGLLKVAQIGAHVFYRFAGHAGADAMFHQAAHPSQPPTLVAADFKTASKTPAGQMLMASLVPAAGAYGASPSTSTPQADRAASTPSVTPKSTAPSAIPSVASKPVAPAASSAPSTTDKAAAAPVKTAEAV
ncbi:cell wall hydrolase [Caulobacter sp. S45]|uniref:cell wall hydrolase n=1 Tax=Caulobacter sp. S45 TaxID=1641861 RepID=UPI001C201F8A|nr:cell wall hydrolase [Caulobacter sp. S45]